MDTTGNPLTPQVCGFRFSAYLSRFGTPSPAGEAVSLADVALLAYTRLAHQGGFHLEGYAAVQRWIGETEQALGLAPVC